MDPCYHRHKKSEKKILYNEGLTVRKIQNWGKGRGTQGRRINSNSSTPFQEHCRTGYGGEELSRIHTSIHKKQTLQINKTLLMPCAPELINQRSQFPSFSIFQRKEEIRQGS